MCQWFVPFYSRTIFRGLDGPHFVHSLVGGHCVSTFRLMSNAVLNVRVLKTQVFVWVYAFIYLVYIFKNGIARSYDNSLFNILRNCQAVFHSGDGFVFCLNGTLVTVCLADCNRPVGVERVSQGLRCCCPVTGGVERVFTGRLASCTSSLGSCLFRSFIWF